MGQYYCWTHGRDYEGTCPLCVAKANAQKVAEAVDRAAQRDAEQQAENRRAMQEAMDEAAFRAEMAAQRDAEEQAENRRAIEEAAARHEEAIANERFLQAEATSQRAFELYEGGLYHDAVGLARDAVKLDPANIGACMCAAWALTALGKQSEARPYFERQIALLAMRRYSDHPALFVRVFEHLPSDSTCLHAFEKVVAEASGSWSESVEPIQLIEGLVSRGRLDSARQLLQRYSQRPTVFVRVFEHIPNDSACVHAMEEVVGEASGSWSPSIEALQLIEALLLRGRLDTARHLILCELGKLADLTPQMRQAWYGVLKKASAAGLIDATDRIFEALAPGAKSLVDHADMLESAGWLGRPYVEEVRRFLATVPGRDRETVLHGFNEMVNNKGRYSDATLTLIRQEVCARYQQWKPDIAELLLRGARSWAEHVAPGSKGKLGWLVGVAIFIAFALAIEALAWLADQAHLQPPPVFPFVIVAFAVGVPIFAGIKVEKNRKSTVARKLEVERLRFVTEEESKAWATVCGNAAEISAPDIWLKAERTVRRAPLSLDGRANGAGNAARGFWWALCAWLIALSLVSVSYDWTPKRKGPVKTMTLSAAGGPLDFKCSGGVVLGGHCYQKGTTFEVVQETTNAICVATRGSPRECYDRNAFLQVARFGSGDVYDYSQTLSDRAQVGLVVGFPILAWIVATVLVKRVRLRAKSG